MSKRLSQLKKHLRAGHVYRRCDLEKFSNAIDRHLKQLQEDSTLTKLSAGIYYCPRKTTFGLVPAQEDKLVSAFLKDDRFLVTSPNEYNALGLGTTQLYNETVVYNHKRHGQFTLGKRVFDFRVKPFFPKKSSEEFLLVDLVNNLDRLAENKDKLLDRVKERVLKMNNKTLSRTVNKYGNVRCQKFFDEILQNIQLSYAT